MTCMRRANGETEFKNSVLTWAAQGIVHEPRHEACFLGFLHPSNSKIKSTLTILDFSKHHTTILLSHRTFRVSSLLPTKRFPARALLVASEHDHPAPAPRIATPPKTVLHSRIAFPTSTVRHPIFVLDSLLYRESTQPLSLHDSIDTRCLIVLDASALSEIIVMPY